MELPAFSKFQILHEVLLKRNGFLNVNEVQNVYLYNNILLMKGIFVGYGTIKIVPKWASFIALVLNILIPFVMDANWKSTGIEALNLVTQASVPIVLNNDAWNTVVVSAFAWYTRCLYTSSEFFLDCYVVLIFLSYILKSYADRPHELSYMICMLHLFNSFIDLFIPPENAISLQNYLFFIISVIFIEAVNETRNISFNPALTLWVVYKFCIVNFSRAPLIKYLKNMPVQENTVFHDISGEMFKRRPIITVDESLHSLFYLIVAVKSFAAAYGMRYVVNEHTTIVNMLVNLIFTFFSGNPSIFEPSVLRLIVFTYFQYVFNDYGFPLITSAAIWFWISVKDDTNHFFLDYYFMMSILIYIKEAYKDNWKKVATLLCYLYCVEWFSDRFIGQPLGIQMTMVTLYVPVTLLSACSDLNSRNRLLSIATFTLVWLGFKLQKYFECGINDYISNFYNMFEAFIY